jgi:O-antigen ligase
MPRDKIRAVLRGYDLRVAHKYLELIAVILSLSLLPVDRFPYLHYVPFKLGAISFILLLLAAGIRLAGVVSQKRWGDLKRIALAVVLLLLPVAAYAQSIHYAIDKPYAKGATKLLLVVALKALCFFVLLYENRSLWKVVKRTVYGVTAVIVAFGFFQFIFDVLGASPRITDLRPCCTSNSTYIFPRVHSVALEPLYFANFLLLPLWLMAHDFIFNKSSRRDKALLVLLVATSSLFILSLARSALLGFIISAIVFLVGLGSSSIKRLIPYALKAVGLILIIALAFVILSGVASKHIHKTAINGSNSGVRGNLGIFGSHAVSVADESAQTRYSTWPKAIDYFKENPINGVGAYNSRVRLNLEQYKKGVPDIDLQPFNNDFLGLMVDLGLIGGLAFGPLVAGVLISLIKSLKRRWATPSAAYALASLAMLIQTNFFQSILLARLWVVAGIALAGIYSLPAKRKASA